MLLWCCAPAGIGVAFPAKRGSWLLRGLSLAGPTLIVTPLEVLIVPHSLQGILQLGLIASPSEEKHDLLDSRELAKYFCLQRYVVQKWGVSC